MRNLYRGKIRKRTADRDFLAQLRQKPLAGNSPFRPGRQTIFSAHNPHLIAFRGDSTVTKTELIPAQDMRDRQTSTHPASILRSPSYPVKNCEAFDRLLQRLVARPIHQSETFASTFPWVTKVVRS